MTKDGCSQVNEEMEKLLGISYKNIANTVYIRQKEVDSLATADATELRKLITKLFGLDEFDSFKDKLTDRASSLQDEIDPLREIVGGLHSQREELNLRISIMASKQKELDTMNQEINNSRSPFSPLSFLIMSRQDFMIEPSLAAEVEFGSMLEARLAISIHLDRVGFASGSPLLSISLAHQKYVLSPRRFHDDR